MQNLSDDPAENLRLNLERGVTSCFREYGTFKTPRAKKQAPEPTEHD